MIESIATSPTPERDEPKVRLRAGTAAELVAMVPYLFGFPPHESVVVLGFKTKRVEGAARLDLPAVFDDEYLGELRARLGDVAAPGNRLIVIGWMDDVTAAEQAVERVVAALGQVDQTIFVSRGRCRQGTGPWVEYPHSVPAAERAGLMLQADRDAVAALVRGPQPADAWDGLWALVCESVEHKTPAERQKRAKELLTKGLDIPHTLSVWERLELAALVRDGAVRDQLWARLTRQTAARFVALWQLIVAVTPDAGAPPVLGLLGMAAWVDGNGALQSCCLNRGLALDPEHSLLKLVHTINMMAIHPKAWTDLVRSHLVHAA